MDNTRLLLAAAVAGAGLGMGAQVAAVDVMRSYLSHGVANCQSALPV